MRKPRRAANSQALPYQRASDGRWCCSVTAGYNPTTGKPIRKVIYGNTSAEVAAKKRELLANLARGQSIAPTSKSLTVKELCYEYLDAKKRSWRPSSYASAEQHIRLHIIPVLGDVRLTALDTRTVSKWLRSKPEGRFMQLARDHLKAACELAIRYEWIERNPVTATEPVKRTRKPAPEISMEQTRAILAATRGNRYHAAVCLMLGCGLRIGEALGLKWSDWDEEAGMLAIERQMTAIHGQAPTLTKPKSRASVGIVQVPRFAAIALVAHREAQEALRAEVEARGGKWDALGLMFTALCGRPARNQGVHNSVMRDLKAAGIEGVTLHHLRHAYASFLIDEGLPLTEVADALRHAGPGVTMQIYAHKIGGKPKRTGAIMDGVFDGGGQEGHG